MHFYNTPVTGNFTDASHPLNIIRGVCQPTDFIVVKLDVDMAALENAIVKEIERDQSLRNCISEMMYERHYDHKGAF